MHRLQLILLPSEFGREPVEQLWMGGPATVEAEVARRLDDAGAEMVVPEAIDLDAGEQRLGGDPLGQFDSAVAFRGVERQAKILTLIAQGKHRPGTQLDELLLHVATRQ